MFSCCKSEKTQLDIIQNTQSCQKHRNPIIFVCKNENQQCFNESLLCNQCMYDHRNHNFQQINKYFTQEIKDTFQTGTSKNGKPVKRATQNIVEGVQKFRCAISDQMKLIQSKVNFQMNNLRKTYPIKGKFGIQGDNLNNQNMRQVMGIIKRQSDQSWIQPLQLFFLRLFSELQKMFVGILTKLEDFFYDRVWQELNTKQKAISLVDEFMEKYRNISVEDPNYFKFSEEQKNPGIKLAREGLQGTFALQDPSKPAALTKNVMKKNHPKIYFEITKADKTAVVFDSTLIALGVCLPKKAKAYNYRKLIDASHGGYLIGNNGKCYHSTDKNYQKKDLSFSFKEGEVIAVWIDYEEEKVCFSKPGFFKDHQFKMELGLKQEQIVQLKPCILFHGEPGAKVTIIGEEPPLKK